MIGRWLVRRRALAGARWHMLRKGFRLGLVASGVEERAWRRYRRLDVLTEWWVGHCRCSLLGHQESADGAVCLRRCCRGARRGVLV
jgi:hypothetical protein